MTDVVCSYISIENGSEACTCKAHVQTKNVSVKRIYYFVSCDLKSQDILRINRKAMNTKQLYELYIFFRITLRSTLESSL